MRFLDRSEAGRLLAQELADVRGPDVVILGLPRGGVAVAFEIARALQAPLDVILVRKLGLPAQPELAMGALGEDGVRIVNRDVVTAEQVSADVFAEVEARETAELRRRARRYRSGHARVPLAGRTAIVVDDGVATGSTALAACQVARAHGADRVVLAVPVAPSAVIAGLAEVADSVICLEEPEPFHAIGQWYHDFTQASDVDVVTLLHRAVASRVVPDSPRAVAAGWTALQVKHATPARHEDVAVTAGEVTLTGRLSVPANPHGMVVFAHGSGSSRHSPRNIFVARMLHGAGLGTLLFDLLTPEEEHGRSAVFDIGLLASRLSAATRWLREQPGIEAAPMGYFGASTGAAAALLAAAEPGSNIAAIVSRGGRPDLAGPALASVHAPTLFVVGGLDDRVLALNQEALAQLPGVGQLVVVPGATHLFTEPGSLEWVADAAQDWFLTHLNHGAAEPAAPPAPPQPASSAVPPGLTPPAGLPPPTGPAQPAGSAQPAGPAHWGEPAQPAAMAPPADFGADPAAGQADSGQPPDTP